MRREGREDPKDNDLFYTCSLIDYIARKIAGNIFFVKKTLKKEKIKHIENRTFFVKKRRS